MPARSLSYLADARRELEEAFEWYLRHSPQAAEAFMRDLDHAAALVTESPAIEVVAVVHQRRRPGYWHDRDV